MKHKVIEKLLILSVLKESTLAGTENNVINLGKNINNHNFKLETNENTDFRRPTPNFTQKS